jgi:hypothetical protein
MHDHLKLGKPVDEVLCTRELQCITPALQRHPRGATLLHVGATLLRVGATLLRVGAMLLRVGATLLRVGATLLRVGATLLRVGATLLRVGATLLRVGATLLHARCARAYLSQGAWGHTFGTRLRVARYCE